MKCHLVRARDHIVQYCTSTDRLGSWLRPSPAHPSSRMHASSNLAAPDPRADPSARERDRLSCHKIIFVGHNTIRSGAAFAHGETHSHRSTRKKHNACRRSFWAAGFVRSNLYKHQQPVLLHQTTDSTETGCTGASRCDSAPQYRNVTDVGSSALAKQRRKSAVVSKTDTTAVLGDPPALLCRSRATRLPLLNCFRPVPDERRRPYAKGGCG